MKKIVYFLFSFAVTGILSSCSDPVENPTQTEDPLVINAVARLISPANNKEIEFSENMQLNLLFEWEKATANNGITPKYEIKFFGENGSAANPAYTVETTKNSAYITYNLLNEIAAKAGISTGSTGVLCWAVQAYHEATKVMSKETFRLVIKRPFAQEDIAKLFLTGRGSEFGENLSDAMGFTKISDAEFVIYSKLTAGQPFKFTNNIEGSNIRSFSVKDGKLVEDGSEAQVTKSGVYSIRVNFSSGSVVMKEVTDISLFYAIRSRAMKLEYEGRGIWKDVCLISFSKESWGDEKRYKFKMTEGGVDKFLEKSDGGSFSMKESVITNQGDQLWNGVWGYADNLKDRWVEVSVDMSKYSHDFKVTTEDFSAAGSSWANIANQSSSDFVVGYWNTSKKHFNNSLTGTVNPYDYWPEAHALDVVIDAYLRTNDSKYQQVISDFYEGVKAKNGGTFKNAYYDDMAWHGLAHLRAFEATNDSRYENSALDLWNWILEGWDNVNGGIKWNTDANSTPGVPSTGPATIIAVRRWVKYGNTETNGGLNDLDWAKKMYEWMREKRHDPATGAVYDDFANKSGAWTYNTGTFLGAAMELYDVTGENHYLEDAIRTADWTLENLSVKAENNRILSDWAEQQDHDVNLFKGIFIRYFARLAMHPDLPSDKKETFRKFIEYNAKALITYASATTDSNILIYNYGWYFKPHDSFLRGQISGCMLIEAAALLEKEGFL